MRIWWPSPGGARRYEPDADTPYVRRCEHLAGQYKLPLSNRSEVASWGDGRVTAAGRL
jgi:hypothetical protein